jgi:exonuclease III
MLLGEDFEELFLYSDEQGRQLYMVVSRRDEKYLIANVNCPNDQKQNVEFIDTVYSKILEILNSYPDCFVFLGGNFNSCATELDYLNRVKLKSEEELTRLIAQCHCIKSMCELTDSYRFVSKAQGFTWNRGECFSKVMASRITNSRVDWAFEKSDHAALITTIKLNPKITKGPGIVKVNPNILNEPLKL